MVRYRLSTDAAGMLRPALVDGIWKKQYVIILILPLRLNRPNLRRRGKLTKRLNAGEEAAT